MRVCDQTTFPGFDQDSHQTHHFQSEAARGGAPQPLVHQDEIGPRFPREDNGLGFPVTKIVSQ